MKKLLNPDIKKLTDKAVLIQVHFQSSPSLPVWFPLSQTHFEEDTQGEKTGEVYIEDFILESKNEALGDYILTEGDL